MFFSLGESGLGKSTLINSLFLSDLYPDKKVPDAKGNGTTTNGGVTNPFIAKSGARNGAPELSSQQLLGFRSLSKVQISFPPFTFAFNSIILCLILNC